MTTDCDLDLLLDAGTELVMDDDTVFALSRCAPKLTASEFCLSASTRGLSVETSLRRLDVETLQGEECTPC